MTSRSTPPGGSEVTGAVVSWWHALVGDRPGGSGHYRTKIMYYQAVVRALTATPDADPTWEQVVLAVQPRGTRSTFYEVTGRNARRSLFNSLVDSGRTDALQLAWCYRRGSAVAQLIDEAKVWSFWPYRQDWLASAARGRGLLTARSLAAVVWDWARREPTLAVALHHMPPACAVEDLITLAAGGMSPTYAVETLTTHIQSAVAAATEPGGWSAPGGEPSGPDVVLRELVDKIRAMDLAACRATGDDETLRRVARDLLEEAMAQL